MSDGSALHDKPGSPWMWRNCGVWRRSSHPHSVYKSITTSREHIYIPFIPGYCRPVTLWAGPDSVCITFPFPGPQKEKLEWALTPSSRSLSLSLADIRFPVKTFPLFEERLETGWLLITPIFLYNSGLWLVRKCRLVFNSSSDGF